MIRKTYMWPVFILMVLSQFIAPLMGVWNSEKVLKNGEEFKFQTLPVDPYDPFRGKYVALRYAVESERYSVRTNQKLKYNSPLYATVKKDSLGFAYFDEIYIDKPMYGENYMTVRFSNHTIGGTMIHLDQDRYYMEESLAKPTEDLVQTNQSRDSLNVHVLMYILDGNARIKDLIIDGQSANEYVRNNEQ